MGLFSKDKRPTISVNADDSARLVEIEASRDATKEAIAEAREATHKLNTLLVDNGFTLKIYLAAGGKHKRSSK